MSSQRLSERNVRRVARVVGVKLVNVVAHGGTHVQSIVSSTHRHGWYDPHSADHGWYDADDVLHFSSCREFFGDYS